MSDALMPVEEFADAVTAVCLTNEEYNRAANAGVVGAALDNRREEYFAARQTVAAAYRRAISEVERVTKDAERMDELERRGVVGIYFADGSQFNPASQSLRAAIDNIRGAVRGDAAIREDAPTKEATHEHRCMWYDRIYGCDHPSIKHVCKCGATHNDENASDTWVPPTAHPAPVQPPADREPTDAVDFKSGEVDVEALRKSAAPADTDEQSVIDWYKSGGQPPADREPLTEAEFLAAVKPASDEFINRPAPADEQEPSRESDRCQFCLGAKGGTNGNENVFAGVLACDYCTVLIQKIQQQPPAPADEQEFDTALAVLVGTYLTPCGESVRRDARTEVMRLYREKK